jgi:hypothetical protein
MSPTPSQPAASDTSLFSTEVRSPEATLHHSASEYERLDRASGPVADRVRGLMDDWFLRLPDTAQRGIRERFTSPDRGTHLGAFWEMYVHEAARCNQFDTDFDVGREDPGRRRPDFLLAPRGDPAASFYVEATVVLGDDAVAVPERTRVQQLYDVIERVVNRNFLLHIDLRAVGPNTPGRRLVADWIDRWLDTLDPDQEVAAVAGGRPPAAVVFDQEGWRVEIQATAYQPDLRGRADLGVIGSRTEGWGTSPAGVEGPRRIDDSTPLAKGLRSKAGHHYELDDRPFLVAVLCGGTFVEDRDIAEALLGPAEYQVEPCGEEAIGEYTPGGLWLAGGGPRNTSVSGIIAAKNLTPSAVSVVEPCLWTNPWAARPFEAELLPWRRLQILNDGQIVEHPAKQSAADLFGINQGWPAVA